jgi:cytochrome c-type biogenesis protein CcmE
VEVTDRPANEPTGGEGAPPSLLARRRPKPKRARYLIAGGLCAAAVVFLLVGGLSRNIVYFRTVSEAVQAHEKAPDDSGRLRMAGAVVAGSVVPQEGGVAFKVTEGGKTVSVVHRGDPGELFKDGAPVVCEGRFVKGTGDGALHFESDRLMIKHGSEYRPPPVEGTSAR